MRFDDTVEGYVLAQKVERDVCLLYHQLAEYSGIMGDLCYGNVFGLPYWEFLIPEGKLDESDKAFIRDGCLVMILAMAWDVIDGSGTYLLSHMAVCRLRVARLAESLEIDGLMKGEQDPRASATRKLVSTVQMALDVAQSGGEEPEQLVTLSNWVHDEYVKGYFRRTTREFDTTSDGAH